MPFFRTLSIYEGTMFVLKCMMLNRTKVSVVEDAGIKEPTYWLRYFENQKEVSTRWGKWAYTWQSKHYMDAFSYVQLWTSVGEIHYSCVEFLFSHLKSDVHILTHPTTNARTHAHEHTQPNSWAKITSQFKLLWLKIRLK